MTQIIKFDASHFDKLMDLIKSEGEEWQDYFLSGKEQLYLDSCQKSITYLLFKDDEVVGFIRSLEDYNYAIYICDLLVHKNHRGHAYGKKLISYVKALYPHFDCYVMSDVDPYYEKLNYEKVGSIFKI
ncbi:MAG: GNAT family N-acetyltransferase [Acholeplasmataceae bacterium]|jgi:ribosomal protein S18 acetylase RimI-like enzyme|nr:GNAT family N-acetyltransferase [Acholeplasmataceae bacterium]